MYILFILDDVCTSNGHVYLDLEYISREINEEKFGSCPTKQREVY